jgi:hypothetical protein
LRTFFSILSQGEIPAEVARGLSDTPAAAAQVEKVEEAVLPPVETPDRAVQILALLQRDGRLIDFLTEDLSPYQDAQVGAAVRELHESCREVLERYIKLEPVIASDEGKPVTVPAGFDPAALKLIGNVTGAPPLRGVLQHRGWRATEVKLPPLPEGEGRAVVAPAEVEIS